ncbi:hypothetical protein CTAYLR_009837 [Chrysophaeum taylorii]|uniref:CRAL-TRIO domain-containing protein n=1 Tax=Chrysophaeum taylorii TaxID=2483200 RepID=A0AAD7U6Y5_9STRA|nr:hypothetical protein CTAYLR_009837 [Chrysophaeum taylorii]
MRALLAEDAKEDELSRRDAALEALGLCSNEELVEGAPLSSGEAEILEYVRSKVPPTDMAELDEYWVLRLVRGGQTTPQRFEEAVATFGRVARWRRELSKHRLDDEFEARMREFATRCVRSVVGGEDLYGHVVWVEQLLDVQMMTEGPRGEMLLARGRLTEGIERFKRAVASRLGVMRYKQIYVLDLAPLSVGPLLGSSDVRAAVEDLISFGSKYYPEGTFRIFIVNAPLVFRSAYAILSPLINPTTREKIRILGPNFLDVMRASGIPTESVPELVGGQHPGREVLDLVLTPKNNPPRGGSFSEMLEDERVSLFTPPPPDEDPRATLFHPPPPDDDLSPVSSTQQRLVRYLGPHRFHPNPRRLTTVGVNVVWTAAFVADGEIAIARSALGHAHHWPQVALTHTMGSSSAV